MLFAGWEQRLLVFAVTAARLAGAAPLSEVLAADILEDSQAERVEKEVPGLVLLLHEAGGAQTQSVPHRPQQQEHVQLRQLPAWRGDLEEGGSKN